MREKCVCTPWREVVQSETKKEKKRLYQVQAADFLQRKKKKKEATDLGLEFTFREFQSKSIF